MLRHSFIVAFSCLFAGYAHSQTTVDFDSLSGYTNVTANGNYLDGHGFGSPPIVWQSEGLTFNPDKPFDPADPGADLSRQGWSYSNVNETVTGSFTNQWAAFSGTDVSGTGNYLIGNSFSANDAVFDLGDMTRIQSASVTNATYAGVIARDGDPGFNTPAFGDDSWFAVTFTGFSEASAAGVETGSQQFVLIDFRFDNPNDDFNYDQWIDVDLTALGAARSVGITFTGSEVGAFGLNTPAYLALDNIVVAAVPEPSSLMILLAVGGVAVTRRRRSAK